MKIMKVLFAVLFLMTMFISCEKDSVNDEVGIEINDEMGNEDEDAPQVQPENGNG